MVIAPPNNQNVSCKLHPYTFQRTRSPASVEEQDTPNECPVYDTKQSDGEALVMLEVWGMRITPWFPLLLGSLFTGVVEPDRAVIV